LGSYLKEKKLGVIMHFFRNKYPMNKSVPVDPVLGQISKK